MSYSSTFNSASIVVFFNLPDNGSGDGNHTQMTYAEDRKVDVNAYMHAHGYLVSVLMFVGRLVVYGINFI
ncbi:hypothetical protein Ccrd_003984 [Cynara cardunculus var. scolymus]|uniref:Uncharacterized protein n=1 Tax=Cynara cardunculus var. scolymus TaxID=59895 RepID=A0A118JWA0_CYNCS|nr:hypothetical protein Ccrd_003984 [Cynara cardunculus var. scolymus]